MAHGDESRPVARLAPLDGIRGVAVLAVLAFHGGVTWMPGGFLGVSAFFTLSGLLIAALLLDEWERNHRIDLRAFWGRRVRRLLPASLVCLAGIVVFGLTQADPTARLDLRGDILAALTQVANWRFVLVERSYADLFAEPSPVLHFWSLAIEEQAYVLVPLLIVGAFAATRSRRAVGVVLIVAAAASSTLLVAIASSGDLTQAYYGTHTRLAEILWGAAAAALIGAPWSQPVRGTRLLGVLSWPAILGLAVLWASASPDAGWVYRLALPIHPFLVLVVLLAAARRVGPARLLAVAPLVGLGRISYGVYLYHWPLFLWLDEQRTGLDGPVLLALRVAASLAAAIVSYRFVEVPVRQMARPRRLGWWPAATIPALVVVGALLVGSAAAPPPAWAEAVPDPPPVVIPPTPSSAADVLPLDTVPLDTVPLDTAPVETVPLDLDHPLRVLVVGDSVSRSLGFGLEAWSRETGAFVVWNTGTPGCGILRSVEVSAAGGPQSTPEGCRSWPDLFVDRIAVFQPDLIVVLVGAWDAGDHRLEDGGPWLAAGDPAFDAAMRADLALASEVLTAGDATVTWLRYPHFNLENYPGVGRAGENPDTPRRLDRLNELFEAMAAADDRIEMIDLPGFMDRHPGGQFDLGLRPDGVHFDDDGALDVARWLGPELVRAAGYSLPATGRIDSADGSSWVPD